MAIAANVNLKGNVIVSLGTKIKTEIYKKYRFFAISEGSNHRKDTEVSQALIRL
jgi:hypothetical protein